MTRADKMPGQTTLVLRFATDGQEFEVDVPATVTISPVVVHTRSEPWSENNPIRHVIGHHAAVDVTVNEAVERILMEHLYSHYFNRAAVGELPEDQPNT